MQLACAGALVLWKCFRWDKVSNQRPCLVEMLSLPVLCSVQRDSHGHARLTRIYACASRHSLVAVARAHNLPSEAPARAAHAHTT